MVVLNIPSGAGFLPSTVGCPAGSDRSDRVVSWFVSSIYGTKPTYSPIFQFPIYLESSSQLHSYIYIYQVTSPLVPNMNMELQDEGVISGFNPFAKSSD